MACKNVVEFYSNDSWPSSRSFRSDLFLLIPCLQVMDDLWYFFLHWSKFSIVKSFLSMAEKYKPIPQAVWPTETT